MSGKKELFKPQNPDRVALYVCGITPYDYAHIGHGRCYVVFDTLYRLLQFFGYNVTYCRNFTDIDDKLLDRAQRDTGNKFNYNQIAQKFIDAYHEDIQVLNCLSPAYEPRVTETIAEIIAFIKGLIEKGKAYQSGNDVYFSIESFPAYGKLSKRHLDELMAGARVAVNEQKRNPLDFALWKGEAEGTFWQSPWGWGRPGWHIECSAMAQKFLGDTLDIHGGGMDLIFPHHENEIAQSESLTLKPLTNYWLHNAFVRINQEKMSKSLGNFFTLRDVFKEYDPMLVRFMILNHHYRSPLDFSFEDLEALRKTYQRLCNLFKETQAQRSFIEKSAVAQKMLDFLRDDLNVAGMWGVVFENFGVLQENEQERAAVKYIIQELLGLTLVPLPEKTVAMTPEIEKLLQERAAARAAKDWAKSDQLRDQLKQLGYEVQDKKSNT